MVKIVRSTPAPASLAQEAKKANGEYNKPDVAKRLRDDFFDKCYICELKGLQDPQVEHRLPHKNGQYPERKFDWNNLFWSCARCNSIKNKQKYDPGIIDCCVKDPERFISIRVAEDIVEAKSIDASDNESVLTAELINEVFSFNNTGLREASLDVRLKSLHREMDKLYRQLSIYKNGQRTELSKNRIRVLLKRETAFAGFKRDYVRRHLSDYPDLSIYLD